MRKSVAAFRFLSGPAPAAALALVLMILFLAQAGLARRVILNTIDAAATVSEDGRRVFVTGPISCTQTERVDLRVTLTQRLTGAIAEGRIRFVGTTTLQHWEVEVCATGRESFDPGPAAAVAVAVTSVRGVANDAHQWLVNITLEEEE
jgi:hypothetical protein